MRLPRPLAHGRAATSFIFVTIALDMLALGIIVPVLPPLIVQLMGGDTLSGARMLGLFGAVWALMQLVCAPILGALSDRFGRRPVVLLSHLGLGLDYVVMALAPSLGWLFAGRLLSGAMAASIPAAAAYLADVHPPERRAAAFGMIGAAFGFGFVLGPAAGGLLGQSDPRLPFWVAGGLTLLNFLYGLFVLPESLPVGAARPFSWRRANPWAALALLREAPGLASLAGVYALSYFAHEALPATFVLYTMHRFDWDSRSVGLVLAAIGTGFAVVQGGLTGPIVSRLGERRTLLAGLLLGAAGFTCFALAPAAKGFVAGIPLLACWGLAGPAAQSLMTRSVGAGDQGRLQGTVQGLRGLSNLIGPLVYTSVFAAAIAPARPAALAGAAFLLSSLVLLLAALALRRRAAWSP